MPGLIGQVYPIAPVAPDSVNEYALNVAELQVAGVLPTAWCKIDGTLTGTNAPLSGYNVASITTLSTGKFQINFIAPMDSLEYSVSMAVDSANFISGKNVCHFNDSTKALDSFQVDAYNVASSAFQAIPLGVHFFGGKT